jgi:2-polyprenyl-6-methoxyphenol hydroxylase-like FAD-dependent oxidoreductase
LEADCLVVGAGATGTAFAAALIDHVDVRVVMIDRAHSTNRDLGDTVLGGR